MTQSQNEPESTALAKSERTMTYTPMGETQSIELSIAAVKANLVRPTRGGSLPSQAQLINFMMLCKSRELNPWVGDAFLVGYDTQSGPEFNLITSVQALLKRAEQNSAFDGMQHGIIVSTGDGHIENRMGAFRMDGETLLGGWCSVYRRDRSIPELSTIRLTSRDKGNSVWTNDPEGMIEKCAIAAALRKSFPTQNGGLYLQEEIDNEPELVASDNRRVSNLAALTQTMSAPSLSGPQNLPPPPGTLPGTVRQAEQETRSRAPSMQATQNTAEPQKPPQEPPKRQRRTRKTKSQPEKEEQDQPATAATAPPSPPVPEPPKQDGKPPFDDPPAQESPPPAEEPPGGLGDIDRIIRWVNHNVDVETQVLAPDGFSDAESDLLVRTRTKLQQFASADDVILGAEDWLDELDAELDGLTDRVIELVETIREVYVSRFRG